MVRLQITPAPLRLTTTGARIPAWDTLPTTHTPLLPTSCFLLSPPTRSATTSSTMEPPPWPQAVQCPSGKLFLSFDVFSLKYTFPYHEFLLRILLTTLTCVLIFQFRFLPSSRKSRRTQSSSTRDPVLVVGHHRLADGGVQHPPHKYKTHRRSDRHVQRYQTERKK